MPLEPYVPPPGTTDPGGGLFNQANLTFPVDLERVDDSVASHVGKITAQDSPLMQAAKTEGAKLANRRGLLNTSMASGASQDAVIRAALPIASQDAATGAARNAGARAFEYGMAGQERDIAFRSDLFDRDLAGRTYLQGQEFDFNRGENALNRDLQERLTSWQLDSSDRNAAGQFLTNMENMFQNQFNQIMANTSLSAIDRTSFLESARNMRDIQLQFVEQLFSIELDW